MNMRKILLSLIALIFAASAAEAKVYLDVYGQSYKKITIAVPPFVSEEKQRTDMSDLLGHDLDLSGFFVVAPKSIMDKEFLSEGVDKKNIRFEQWRSIGVELLCKAVVQEKDNNLSVEAYLYDSGDGTLLFAKRYRATPAEFRRIVHRLADDIILTVTGEKGIMSSRVVIVAGDKRRRDIYAADLDGYGPRKITNQNNIVVSPSVSPDGRYLAFTSYREGRPNMYVTELGSGREVYADRQEGMKVGATWIDKKNVAYAHTSGRFSTIYSLNVETKEKKVLLRKEGILASPTFSPDGSKMAFVSDMYGGPNIFIKDMGSPDIKRLSYFGNYNTSPAFSPKGDLIAFVSKTEGALEVCVMRPDGSNARVLSDGGINDSPSFSPCGRYILYSSQKGKKTAIYMMLYNGENRRELKFTGAEETQPKFMP
jgi:TolB protein